MNSHHISIQTQATGRQIRQAMLALLKSQAISSWHKIPHVKYFSLDENKKTLTTTTQLLILRPTEKWSHVWKKILDQTLVSWSESDIIF